MTIIYHLAAGQDLWPAPFSAALGRLDRMRDNAAKACATHVGSASASILQFDLPNNYLFDALSATFWIKNVPAHRYNNWLWDGNCWRVEGICRMPTVKTTNGAWSNISADFSPFIPPTCVNQRPSSGSGSGSRDIISARHELKCIMTNILQSLLQTVGWGVQCARWPSFSLPCTGGSQG